LHLDGFTPETIRRSVVEPGDKDHTTYDRMAAHRQAFQDPFIAGKAAIGFNSFLRWAINQASNIQCDIISRSSGWMASDTHR
jgi:hypothetical protein